MKILWFKKVGEIANNNKSFKATPDNPWNPEASFAVYQKEEGWVEGIAKRHYEISKCKGEFRVTANDNGFIAYMNNKEDNSSVVSSELLAMLKA
tara:strand:- start:68 stop:349 length:282 start_codon:yes stop_codon:yes gene_type:complete